MTDQPIKKRANLRQSGETKIYSMLFFNFLKISQSYALANKFVLERTSKLKQRKLILNHYRKSDAESWTKPEEDAIVDSFKKVLETREKFGDVSKLKFNEWWSEKIEEAFNLDHEFARVRLISKLSQDLPIEDTTFEYDINHYLLVDRPNEKAPTALIVSIPMGVPKNELLLYLDVLISKHQTTVTPKKLLNKFKFSGQRIHKKPLFSYLQALMGYASTDGELSLWEVGLLVNSSPKNCANFEFGVTKRTASNSHELNTIAILTHRHLTYAQLIAENAAHGIFPSKAKVRLPPLDKKFISEVEL